ncbi:MAG: hypothetical protein PHH31_04675 [Acidaminococcaceae bacterium]|nr:hypothetical protein [Acidaminococcaceae bacterium]
MFALDYIEKCLNLKGIIVKNIVNIAEEQHIYLSLPVQEQCCPHCGQLTSYIKITENKELKTLELSVVRYIYTSVKENMSVKMFQNISFCFENH